MKTATGVLAAYRKKREAKIKQMLAKRLQAVIILIPVIIGVTFVGGWVYTAAIALFLGVAAWEFWRIFSQGGYHPSRALLIGGTVFFILFRQLFGFQNTDISLVAIIFIAMFTHILAFEHGNTCAACDFSITLTGILYLGWLGGYFISLRNLSGGAWWLLIVFSASWIADGGAYFIGSRFGKKAMAPKVSPKKSWEGYLGGLVTSIFFTTLLAWVWHLKMPMITPGEGAVAALAIAGFSPLGDLGMSMIKRQFGVKDSSNLIPGHGGVLDRLDSLLWAAAIGYYVIVWLF